jgi:hypothetical protein
MIINLITVFIVMLLFRKNFLKERAARNTNYFNQTTRTGQNNNGLGERGDGRKSAKIKPY